jgi:hypothetical protein
MMRQTNGINLLVVDFGLTVSTYSPQKHPVFIPLTVEGFRPD